MPKRILVVSDTGGLGNLFCQHFLARGDDVRGLSRKAAILQNENGLDWPHYCFDASDYAALELFATELQGEDWRPEVVLNCTGLADHNPILMLSAEKFVDMITSNLTTSFATNQVFGKLLLGDPDAVICNFSSIHVTQQTRGAGSYIVAKSAVETMTGVFCNEVSGLGPRFICLRLPFVKDVGMAKETNILRDDGKGAASKYTTKSFEEVMTSVVSHINGEADTTNPIQSI